MNKLHIRCGECDTRIPVPGTPDTIVGTGAMYELWTAHGHFPGKATFECICGAAFDTGPEVWGHTDPADAAEKDRAWLLAHANCTGALEAPAVPVAPKRQCPRCGANLDKHVPMGNYGNAAPSPGDLSVCVYCQSLLEFSAPLAPEGPPGVVLLSPDVFAALPQETKDDLKRMQIKAKDITDAKPPIAGEQAEGEWVEGGTRLQIYKDALKHLHSVAKGDTKKDDAIRRIASMMGESYHTLAGVLTIMSALIAFDHELGTHLLAVAAKTRKEVEEIATKSGVPLPSNWHPQSSRSDDDKEEPKTWRKIS